VHRRGRRDNSGCRAPSRLGGAERHRCGCKEQRRNQLCRSLGTQHRLRAQQAHESVRAGLEAAARCHAHRERRRCERGDVKGETKRAGAWGARQRQRAAQRQARRRGSAQQRALSGAGAHARAGEAAQRATRRQWLQRRRKKWIAGRALGLALPQRVQLRGHLGAKAA
jgi:hypothetical protein